MSQAFARLFALAPLVLFVVLFLVSTVWFSSQVSPLFSVMLAVIFALFTFPAGTAFNSKVEVFIEGASQPTVVSMIYIYIFTSVFTYIADKIGAIDAAVRCGLFLIPDWFLLPGLFIVVGLFATSIGSSMGTIAAFLPIGMGIASSAGISPALMAGLVVSGAMLGDNLSIISDTTIAAVKTIGAHMDAKFRENLRLVAPAFFITILLLFFLGYGTVGVSGVSRTMGRGDLVRIIPYGVLFSLALAGFDVLAVLIAGVMSAMGIGVALGAFSFTESTGLLLEGFSQSRDIHEVLLLSLFVSGLARIAEVNGGIRYLLGALSKKITTKRGGEAAIALLVFVVNAVTAINTIALLITGPVVKTIAEQFGLKKSRVAALADIMACVCQGILPYAPQLLLAASIANISSVAIIPYLYYQGFIFIIACISIIRNTFVVAYEK